jgi:integrating conjugative element protein (TIGR03749 family)
MLSLCLATTIYADSISSLTLTDAEMQKLKKYFPADDISHLVWKGDPISVLLPINKEKRIIFPTSVTVDVKSALSLDQLRILNNDKSLYLTALKSFPTTRIYITLKESGEVVLVDLSTGENANNTTQEITIKQNNHAAESNVVATSSETSTQVTDEYPRSSDINDADFIRYAWQEVYAPERLIQNKSRFTRAPMHTEEFIADLIYGDKVIAHPEGSWISGNRYVTAILLRNKYAHNTHINMNNDICGDWQAGLLYPSANLKPYGDKRGDSAMLFLVSNRPFGEILGVCHGDA